MTTHSIRIKAIILSIVLLLCVVVAPCINSKADSFPSNFFVNSNIYYSSEEMYYAYNDLNYTQREICSYLLGMYNLMYLGSRGFSFKAGAYRNESEFIAKIRSLGYRFLQGAAEIALKSRMNDDFCKYASACILYSSQCNVNDFDTWFSNLDEDFTLPVDEGIINSFTLLYNDNDVNDIAVEGDVVSNWESGNLYSRAWPELEITDGINNYNNFFSDSFVKCFTNYNSSNQYCFKPYVTFHYIDSLYILRGSTYQDYRWGSSQFVGTIMDDNNHNVPAIWFINRGSYVQCNNSTSVFFKGAVQSTSSNYTDLSQFINQCFIATPFRTSIITFDYCYPYIEHVYLVDSLTTYSNLEEVFSISSWDLVGGNNNSMLVPVDNIELKPKVIATINLPSNNVVDVPIQDIINDTNTVDNNGDPVNPWQQPIIVQPNDTNPISVSVNLFTGAKSYVRYLWESSEKFIQYSATLLNCFEFEDSYGKKYGPKIAILGVVTLGIAGGLIAKFLL